METVGDWIRKSDLKFRVKPNILPLTCRFFALLLPNDDENHAPHKIPCNNHGTGCSRRVNTAKCGHVRTLIASLGGTETKIIFASKNDTFMFSIKNENRTFFSLMAKVNRWNCKLADQLSHQLSKLERGIDDVVFPIILHSVRVPDILFISTVYLVIFLDCSSKKIARLRRAEPI